LQIACAGGYTQLFSIAVTGSVNRSISLIHSKILSPSAQKLTPGIAVSSKSTHFYPHSDIKSSLPFCHSLHRDCSPLFSLPFSLLYLTALSKKTIDPVFLHNAQSGALRGWVIAMFVIPLLGFRVHWEDHKRSYLRDEDMEAQ
jgi:hypothetical protein